MKQLFLFLLASLLYIGSASAQSSSTTYHSENAYIGSRNGGNVVVESLNKSLTSVGL